MPIRVQRKRSKGWRMPPNTVYVGRRSRWGNPYKIMDGWTAEDVVKQYKEYLNRGGAEHFSQEVQKYLSGKNLACWCPLNQPCHADVLLEIANRAI